MTDLHERAAACIEGRGWFTNAERGELIRELLDENQKLDIARWDEHLRVLSENERLRAEVEALRRDAERLDWLDTLTKRTAPFGHNNKQWPLSTDMHFDRNTVSIFVRTGVGSMCANQSHDENVRAAIDAAMQQENPR